MSTIDKSMSRYIVVDGLPNNVTPEKRGAFQNHINRKFGEVLGHNQFQIHLQSDAETGLVCGAFMMFVTESDAEAALAKLNLFRLTRSDVVRTYRWSALEDINTEEEYVAPTLPDGDDEDGGTLCNNMAEDEQARPQFLVKGGLALDCEWYWFDWEKNEPTLYRRPHLRKDDSIGQWSELDRLRKNLREGCVSSLVPVVRPMPIWSPHGTMMISQHETGLRVWGGRAMNLLFEIAAEVEAFMVSPCEKFIVIKTVNDLSVWNLRTARRIRTLGNLDLHSDDLWPITRFSADDSLVAVCKTGYNPDTNATSTGRLNIYVSESMRVVKGESNAAAGYTFGVDGLYKAEWNPAVGTQMAYVAYCGENAGWKVVIADIDYDEEDNIASEHQVASRIFANAVRLDMLWHPAGTYLAVKVTQKKTVEYCLFHLGHRGAAAIQLQVKPNHSANRFAWQPGGDYFAIILEKNAPTGGSAKAQLSETSVLQIYSIKQNKPKVVFESLTSATHLFWAPKGTHLVVINFAKSLLQFFYINDSGVVIERNKLSSISGTDAQWDPTGRFLATWVSSLRNTTMASQYRIFDYNGNELFRKTTKPFSHLMWRPLPPTVLEQGEVKTIKDSLKLLVEKYEADNAERREDERLKVVRRNQELEEAYIRKMNDLARKMRDQRLVEKRRELQESSPWGRYWKTRLQALPEEERQIHEDITEERIIARRPL